MMNWIKARRENCHASLNGEARAILLDTDSYQSMRNTLGILKLISQSEKEIEKNLTRKHEEVVKKIENN